MYSEDIYKVRDILDKVLDIKCFLYGEEDPYEEEKIDILNDICDLIHSYEELQ